MATRAELAHLLRRATFGPRADEVDAAERVGFDATLAGLLDPTGTAATLPHFATDPLVDLPRDADRTARQRAQQQLRDEVETGTTWWLDRMGTADRHVAEELGVFWPGPWATAG